MQSTGSSEARFRPVFSHLGAVTAYARRRGSLDADALAAEVMTIAWRRLADVPEDDPRPWLYATARNLLLAESRRAATARRHEHELVEQTLRVGRLRARSAARRRAARALAARPRGAPPDRLGGADPDRGRPLARHQADRVPRAPPAGPPASRGEARRSHNRTRHQADHGEDMKSDSLLTRLQAANPEPLIVQTDSFDLFNEITALPADPRLSTPTRKPLFRRRGLALAIAFAVAALLASTAFAISRLVGNDVVGPDVTRAEYLAAQSRLELPPGATWPRYDMGPANTVTGRGAGGGIAVLTAQNAWECYWVRSIRSGDTARQAALTPHSTTCSRTTSSRHPPAHRRTGCPRSRPRFRSSSTPMTAA